MKYISRLLSNNGSRHGAPRPADTVYKLHSFARALPGILALGLAALLPAGCIEGGIGGGHRPGTIVKFSVSTGYDNVPPSTSVKEGSNDTVPETKTSYSGQEFTVGSSKWERIDWVNGDLFSVHCDAAQGTLKKADYKVLSHSDSNEKSLADIAPASGNGLQWGTGEHVFYAMYPAASTPGVDASKVSLDGNVMRGTIPYDGSDPANKPAWLTLDAYSGPGSTSGEQRAVRIGHAPHASFAMQFAGPGIEAANQPLRTAAQVGTPSACWNLANPSDGGDFIVESANCYVINAPGYYRIPLVVGNGVKNNAPNPTAYTAENFKDYRDANIVSPYLHKTSSGAGVPTGAHVVWSEGRYLDVTGSDWDIAPVGGAASPVTTTGSGANLVYWLNFHVDRDRIRQGNAIVAVTDAGGTVMWSWHLWLTDYVPANYPAYASGPEQDIPVTNHGGYVYTFTPRSLGWTINGCTETAVYAERTAYAKLVQDAGGNSITMKIRQTGGTQTVTIPTGDHSPFYQFGRKDPMMPSDGTASNQTLSPLFGRVTAFQNVNARQTVGTAIRNPGTNYGYNGAEPYDWCSDTDRKNWWSAGNTATTFNDNPVVKTVYDPCPAGYRLPASNAFTGFTTNGQNGGTKNVSGAWENGWNFNNRIASPNATVYFPASGGRTLSDGSLNYVGNYGIYWSAGPYYTDHGCHMNFSQWNVNPQTHSRRPYGFSVRPVQDLPVVSPGIGAGISTGGQKSNDVNAGTGWY